jgi:competence protein ComEC
LYIKASNKADSLDIGTKFICYSSIKLLKDDTLFAKGYKDYLARQGIYHSAYLNSKNYFICTNNHPSSLQNLIQHLQYKTISLLRGAIHDSSSCALAEALLIGYRNDMDKSQVKI